MHTEHVVCIFREIHLLQQLKKERKKKRGPEFLSGQQTERDTGDEYWNDNRVG